MLHLDYPPWNRILIVREQLGVCFISTHIGLLTRPESNGCPPIHVTICLQQHTRRKIIEPSAIVDIFYGVIEQLENDTILISLILSERVELILILFDQSIEIFPGGFIFVGDLPIQNCFFDVLFNLSHQGTGLDLQ